MKKMDDTYPQLEILCVFLQFTVVMFIAESVDQRPPAPQRGVKRPREGYSGRKRVTTLLGSS